MAKREVKPTVTASRLHVVYWDAPNDTLSCTTFDSTEEMAVFLAGLSADVQYVIINGFQVSSESKENVSVISIGGVAYTVVRNAGGTEVSADDSEDLPETEPGDGE